MSTRALIGLVNPKDGSIFLTSVNHDGYPSHLGKMLLHHYDSTELALELLSMGDASDIGRSVSFSKFYRTVYRAGNRSWKSGTGPHFATDKNRFYEIAKVSFIDYVYLREAGAWKYAEVPVGEKKFSFKPLTEAVIKADAKRR